MKQIHNSYIFTRSYTLTTQPFPQSASIHKTTMLGWLNGKIKTNLTRVHNQVSEYSMSLILERRECECKNLNKFVMVVLWSLLGGNFICYLHKFVQINKIVNGEIWAILLYLMGRMACYDCLYSYPLHLMLWLSSLS